MIFRNRVVVTLSAALTLVSIAAHAQRDSVLLVKHTRSLSNNDVRALDPVANTLEAPDTSSVIADTIVGPEPQGVMTKEGPVYVNDYSKAFGSFGIPYTTTRVQEGSSSALGSTRLNRLSTSYPYSTIGKLTFNEGYCSAALIRRSVIVTAAHCIQDFGSGSNVFTNHKFIPGHYGTAVATPAQFAPYGEWAGWRVVRPSTWASGTDTGCGAARNNDLAVIALKKNLSGQFLGDIVGYMGYGWGNYSFVTSPKTGNLNTAAVSTLGYPFSMDSGEIMQRTDGPAYTTTVCSAKQLWQGSNLTGGSSGGPWVVNFSGRNPKLSGGAVPGNQSLVSVIGVTSWGSLDPNAPKDNYSSQFGTNPQYPNAAYGVYGAGNIGSLLNTLCSSAAPGGGTLASQGYCN